MPGNGERMSAICSRKASSAVGWTPFRRTPFMLPAALRTAARFSWMHLPMGTMTPGCAPPSICLSGSYPPGAGASSFSPRTSARCCTTNGPVSSLPGTRRRADDGCRSAGQRDRRRFSDAPRSLKAQDGYRYDGYALLRLGISRRNFRPDYARAAFAFQKARRRRKNSKEICSLSELTPGDYVVHATHGIGVFEGIHKIDMQELSRTISGPLRQKATRLRPGYPATLSPNISAPGRIPA